MPFRLMNAPTILMDLMNRVCKPFLDKFVITFIYDILIYLRCEEKHEDQLRKVLQLLTKENSMRVLKMWVLLMGIPILAHIVWHKGLKVYLMKFVVVMK